MRAGNQRRVEHRAETRLLTRAGCGPTDIPPGLAWLCRVFTCTGRATPSPGCSTINFYFLQASKAKISVNTQPQKFACGLGRAEAVLCLPNYKALLRWVVSRGGFCGEEVFPVVRAGSGAPGDLDPIPGSRSRESSDCRKSHTHSGAALPLPMPPC